MSQCSGRRGAERGTGSDTMRSEQRVLDLRYVVMLQFKVASTRETQDSAHQAAFRRSPPKPPHILLVKNDFDKLEGFFRPIT